MFSSIKGNANAKATVPDDSEFTTAVEKAKAELGKNLDEDCKKLSKPTTFATEYKKVEDLIAELEHGKEELTFKALSGKLVDINNATLELEKKNRTARETSDLYRTALSTKRREAYEAENPKEPKKRKTAEAEASEIPSMHSCHPHNH